MQKFNHVVERDKETSTTEMEKVEKKTHLWLCFDVCDRKKPDRERGREDVQSKSTA